MLSITKRVLSSRIWLAKNDQELNHFLKIAENGKNVVYGISSWGIGCGEPNNTVEPNNVFTEVFGVIDFIKDVIVRF